MVLVVFGVNAVFFVVGSPVFGWAGSDRMNTPWSMKAAANRVYPKGAFACDWPGLYTPRLALA